MTKPLNDLMALVLLVIFVPVVVFAWFYFSESKKKENNKPETIFVTTSDLLCSPQITVVFQKDIADDEELIQEIADMYISNRTYYYLGKDTQVLSEKDVFIRYDSIDFYSLKAIDI